MREPCIKLLKNPELCVKNALVYFKLLTIYVILRGYTLNF